MIGSFIGTFAVGLLSAHVYYNGSAIRRKIENAYDTFLDIFREAPGDKERMRLSPEEEAEAGDCKKKPPKPPKPPKKHDEDDTPTVKDKVKAKKSKTKDKSKANARKRDAKGHFVKTK